MILTLSGDADIYADRAVVWDALHDPSGLKRCIPGCQAIERVSPTRFELSVRIGLGMLALPVSGAVDICDCERPRSLSLRATGAGGVTGLVSGQLKMTLLERPSGCRIAYVAEIEPKGAFATLGSGLFARRAHRMVDRFVTNFAATVGVSPLERSSASRSDILSSAPKA